MTALSADLFQSGGKYWLVVADVLSGSPFARRLHSLSTSAIMKEFRDIFARSWTSQQNQKRWGTSVQVRVCFILRVTGYCA